jgi:diacylglycerol kinase family enzyme
VSGFLIVNPRAGRGRPSTHELVDEARRRGIEVHVLSRGEDAAAIVRSADASVVGMAGGDGSVAPVAEVCIELDRPFVSVPFGTHNHFARDLGLDTDEPFSALAAFENGHELRLDVGRADGRLFVNNVSLGLYARLVHHRERRRRRRELLARLRALALVARERHSVGLSIDDEPVAARIVLIANNAYTLDLFSLGERERLDEGVLHVYVATGLFPNEWLERTRPRVVIDSTASRLRAAIDGEPAELEPPVELTAHPSALRVLVPRR